MSNFPERSIVLVVDRSSRQVIDCASIQFSWDLEHVIERHNPGQVDVIIRQAQSTVIPKATEAEAPIATAEESEELAPVLGVGADYNPEDDIPF